MKDYRIHEGGQSIVEYILILSLISLIAFAALRGVGLLTGEGSGGLGPSEPGDAHPGEDIDDDSPVELVPLEALGFKGEYDDELGGVRLTYIGDGIDYLDIEVPVRVVYYGGYYVEDVHVGDWDYDVAYSINGESVDGDETGINYVVSLEGAFSKLSDVEGVKLTLHPVNKLESVKDMFRESKSLKSVDLSDFNASSIKDMGYTFGFCESLEDLDLSGLGTSSVLSMNGMFRACKSLRSLDLSGFDTRNVKDMSYMFDSCTGLEELKYGMNFKIASLHDGITKNAHSGVVRIIGGLK